MSRNSKSFPERRATRSQGEPPPDLPQEDPASISLLRKTLLQTRAEVAELRQQLGGQAQQQQQLEKLNAEIKELKQQRLREQQQQEEERLQMQREEGRQRLQQEERQRLQQERSRLQRENRQQLLQEEQQRVQEEERQRAEAEEQQRLQQEERQRQRLQQEERQRHHREAWQRQQMAMQRTSAAENNFDPPSTNGGNPMVAPLAQRSNQAPRFAYFALPNSGSVPDLNHIPLQCNLQPAVHNQVATHYFLAPAQNMRAPLPVGNAVPQQHHCENRFHPYQATGHSSQQPAQEDRRAARRREKNRRHREAMKALRALDASMAAAGLDSPLTRLRREQSNI